MVESLAISERRACCYAGLSRTSYREPPRMDQAAAELSARIVTLAQERRRSWASSTMRALNSTVLVLIAGGAR